MKNTCIICTVRTVCIPVGRWFWLGMIASSTVTGHFLQKSIRYFVSQNGGPCCLYNVQQPGVQGVLCFGIVRRFNIINEPLTVPVAKCTQAPVYSAVDSCRQLLRQPGLCEASPSDGFAITVTGSPLLGDRQPICLTHPYCHNCDDSPRNLTRKRLNEYMCSREVSRPTATGSTYLNAVSAEQVVN